jgi:ribonuclease HII
MVKRINMLQLRHTEDEAIEVGIDEAGRGCLWGPLYAAAVIWPPEMTPEQEAIAPLIKDSKKVTAKRRIALAQSIKDHALDWGIGIVSSAEIDQVGMTKANQLAFTRALNSLSIEPERLLIDGILSIYENPWCFTEQVVEPEADGKYLPVAAASILAKTEHDAWVREFCDLNENIAERYDLTSCKGYGTAKHRTGILEFGEHEFHRKLFLRKLYAGRQVEDDSMLKVKEEFTELE